MQIRKINGQIVEANSPKDEAVNDLLYIKNILDKAIKEFKQDNPQRIASEVVGSMVRISDSSWYKHYFK